MIDDLLKSAKDFISNIVKEPCRYHDTEDACDCCPCCCDCCTCEENE